MGPHIIPTIINSTCVRTLISLTGKKGCKIEPLLVQNYPTSLFLIITPSIFFKRTLILYLTYIEYKQITSEKINIIITFIIISSEIMQINKISSIFS